MLTAQASALSRVLEELPQEERLILPCLQRIQHEFGYVTDEAIDAVTDFLNVSRAEVVGVVSYYHDLRRTPPADIVVDVCGAEACQAQGSRSLAAEIDTAVKGAPDVEIRTVYCLGNCALGPAAMVNGRLIGRCDIAILQAAMEAAR